MYIKLDDEVEFNDEVNVRNYFNMVLVPIINHTFPGLEIEVLEDEEIKFITIYLDGVKNDPDTGTS